MSALNQSGGGATARPGPDEESYGFVATTQQEFVSLGPDTMSPEPVDDSFNNEPSSSQPFSGFGNYAGTNAEPLLPMEGQQGFRAQAPMFQAPGYMPTPDLGDMRQISIPEAHVMSSDAGGNDGYVFNNNSNNTSIPPAVPQQSPATSTAVPRNMQLPSQVLESRQAGPSSQQSYDPSLISIWHPHEFLPEDYPDLDPDYATIDPAHPPRMSPKIPEDAWVPSEIFREPTGTSIIEPHSVQGENGRLYHGYREGQYMLPNDPAEQDRLDLQHFGLKTLLGGRLFLAPIKNPRHILDIATGTGIWPNELAELFPNAQIVGTDLSQIQPESKPENVSFVREDSEEEWCHDVKFDYIHARAVVSCFNHPKQMMQRVFDNLNPGGYAEYMDCYGLAGCLDGTLRGTALEKFWMSMVEGGAAIGRDFMVASHYKEWMEEIGFVDVVERKMAWPFGGWAKDPRIKLAGLYCQRDFYDGIGGASYKLLKKIGMADEEIDRFLEDVRADMVNPAIHAYLPVVTVYGRKPEARENVQEARQQASSAAEMPPPPPPTERSGFEPQEFLSEDFPEIDPLYQQPNVVSSAFVPPSQSGIPPEAWVPAEVYRESSGGSVVEPNSVVEENGRTYHGYKEGSYWIPNDPTEQERLDLQHYTCNLLLHHRLYLAPLQDPRHVLDIATGTGLWAMDFAREHPGAHILGTDLSKIQPENPPENIEFIRDDAEKPWEFGTTKFDYIHLRFVFSCFNDPKFVMRQAFEHMSPGGWIEYMDSTTDFASMDGSVEGTTIQRWGELMRSGAAMRGRNLDVTRFYKQWLEEIGFVDVQERKFAGVLGPWCKDARMKHVGRLGARNLYDNISGISFRLLEAQGYSTAQVEEFAANFRADLVNPTVHAYCPM
ncbi:hypothetical protein PG990_003156 [Apiospora arundinis]